MTTTASFPLEGGCGCRRLRYRMTSAPLFVHCCHCRWCQRESGASFALNAMIEADRVQLLAGMPELVHTPSDSGMGQKIARCPHCRIALWSHYAGAGPLVSFVRVGTLDQPDQLPPDVHIFTASKQPWVLLRPGTPAVPEYYDRDQLWPVASLARRQVLLPQIEAYQASMKASAAENAVLRQATRDDIAGIFRVRYAVQENTLRRGIINDEDCRREMEDTGRGWVVEVAGEIVAFAIGNADSGNIWALFVDPPAQGQGHGARLYDAMVAWLWSRGLQTLWLTTGPATRARGFYERRGWRDSGRVEHGDMVFELDRPTAAAAR